MKWPLRWMQKRGETVLLWLQAEVPHGQRIEVPGRLTAGRVARCALLEKEQPLAEAAKRGGACLFAHGRSSFPASRPRPPTGVLASGASYHSVRPHQPPQTPI